VRRGNSSLCTASTTNMCYLVHHFLEKSADSNPDKEALLDGDVRLTYWEIELKANKVANWLLESGVRKGDRVALLLRNSGEYVSCYYGIQKAGGIVVPLNTGLGLKELKEILEDCSSEVLITENHFLKKIDQTPKAEPFNIRVLANVYEDYSPRIISGGQYFNFREIHSRYPEMRPGLPIVDCDLSSIIYTSGSTGRPKGATLTHGNIVANTRSITSYLRLTGKDRCMVILPFYYVYGKSLLNTHFRVSGTVIIDNRFAFPNAVLQRMREEKATGFAGVPSTFSILVNNSSMRSMEFPDLRYITQAGGHMSAAIKKELMKILPDKEIFIMYGATEASARLTYLDPKDLSRKIDSIGKAIPNTELRILAESGREAEPGEEGEIVARGSNIMQGYWNDPVETDKVIKDGWYHTGDLGYRDEEGFFFMRGRKREMVKVGIHKVSTIEIEDVLYQHPSVFEAAVVGIPDQNLGEALKAFIVLKEGCNTGEREFIEFCEERLPKYKIPKKIVFISDLPKNESGKIQKRGLMEAPK